MATFGTSTTCQIGDDGRTATARTSGTECAFAYSSEPLGGGFHRWTLAVQRAPPEEGGEAPAGWGVCIGVVADGAPTKRLPAASRAPLAPTAAGGAGVVSGVHLDAAAAEGGRRRRGSAAGVEAGSGAAPRAWGWNPSSRAIFAAADPRQWGFPVVTLPAPAVVAGAAAGEEAGAGAAAVVVTVCVDLGKEGAKGAPTRSLYVGVEGQPLQRVVLPLPRDARLWVQLLPGCGGVEVQRYERFGLINSLIHY
ncbi:hypothetical protein EMIHUDRAFT_115121 [Emiliania huxleyi CCMP1516]|uniref:Uncharacterized protein n=2 Tax=Emiliania huxleyi TaxID=2903 RepID=A0A0D3JRX8_EMIH1|nr:hypothetical protein EMIHUDRAFT_115121 [Emiliania huxleyi CCMP1516]EOD26263.1 hypothetical protein EMIHUDRAFT_115121 [Emiliania huxleyi CCMP1516]|eukprot:XP_005778692.1 hypothetical protein EMIHUDRAFT_115121 [Emiliania huxleyi CCMP1516]